MPENLSPDTLPSIEPPAGESEWIQLAWVAAAIFGAAILALLVHAIIFAILGRIAKRTGWQFDEVIVARLKRPARWLLVLLGSLLAAYQTRVPWESEGLVRHGISLGLMAMVAWVVVALLKAGEDVILKKHRVDVEDNLEARRLHTQVHVITRALVIVVTVLAAGSMLMTFEGVREIGASILASAGIAGLAVGFAARPVLSNLIAGIQLALTQPIRLDDVVIVEGEWGWIEEITPTYVVVRIWDLRRLVVPLSHFIEKPFQNWTRRSADILGTVFIYADYTVPLAAVREELEKICKSSSNWDGKVVGLQVTNASEHTVELRALMSSADSSKNWDLRCAVREKLIDFLQREHPGCLPKIRAELPGGAPTNPGGGKSTQTRATRARKTTPHKDS